MTMLFSCENDISKIKVSNAEELPIIQSNGIQTIYSDSAVVRLKITGPELKEFAETDDKEAYIEFPKGLKATFYNQSGRIESSLEAEYAIFWKKVKQFEARTNVVVKNFSEKQELFTEQLFWDKDEEKIWSDKFVKIITENGPTYGEEGFESDQNFAKFRIKKSRGQMTVEDKDTQKND
jgi:LPS export ABC transporter protein LptC